MSGQNPLTEEEEEEIRKWKKSIPKLKEDNLKNIEGLQKSYKQKKKEYEAYTKEYEAFIKKFDYDLNTARLEKNVIKIWETKLADLNPTKRSITKKVIVVVWAEIKRLLKDKNKDGLRIQVGYYITCLILILNLSVLI